MKDMTKIEQPHLQRCIVAVCFLLVLAIFVVIWVTPSFGYDWIVSFAPAGRDWLHPYDHLFHNPPWVAPVLWPLAVLPLRIGFVMSGLLAIAMAVWLISQEGGSWLAILATLLSPAFICTLINGNIEWLPLLGIVIGNAWGVPLLLAKPQAGGVAALLFFKRAEFDWRFWLPSVGVVAVSLLIWGWWPSQIPLLPDHFGEWNVSIFPWGVPLGIVCVWLAWKHDSLRWALLAGTLLSPYFSFASLTPAVAVWSAKYPRAVGLVVAVFWILVGLFILRWG